MKNLIDKLKKYKGAIISGTAAAVIVSGLAIGDSIKSYELGHGVFQGYNILPYNGRIEYVFDPKNETERGFTAPKHRICGDPSLTDSLKIGESYCFTTKKGSLPWSKKYIDSINSTDSIIDSIIDSIPYNTKDSKNELR